MSGNKGLLVEGKIINLDTKVLLTRITKNHPRRGWKPYSKWRGDCGKVNHARAVQSTRWFGQVILIVPYHCHCCIILSYQASVSESCLGPDSVPQCTVPALVTIASVPQRSGAPTKHRQVRRRGSLRKEGREGMRGTGTPAIAREKLKAEEGDQRTVRFYFHWATSTPIRKKRKVRTIDENEIHCLRDHPLPVKVFLGETTEICDDPDPTRILRLVQTQLLLTRHNIPRERLHHQLLSLRFKMSRSAGRRVSIALLKMTWSCDCVPNQNQK
jgi:hypothetical protein